MSQPRQTISEGPYIILVSDSSKELKERVNHYITLGYDPLGGVSCSEAIALNDNYSRHETMFAQAMLKKTGLKIFLFNLFNKKQ